MEKDVNERYSQLGDVFQAQVVRGFIDKMKREEQHINKLCHIATFSKCDARASRAMKLLHKVDLTYHWCFDWDELVICANDREASCCTCGITAIELWHNKKFIKKRIVEQRVYLFTLASKQNDDQNRFVELRDAAYWQLNKFEERLRELNSREE